MRHRYFPLIGLTGLALLLATVPVTGQTSKPAAKATTAKTSAIKRMPDGHPDLQGIYDIATLTPVDRRGTNLILTKEEAAKLEAEAAQLKAQGDQAIAGDRTAPPKGGDGSVGAAGNVGGYNRGWLDGGSTYNVVDGQKRSSIIIDPPNGHVPPMAPGASQRFAGARARPTSDETESNDPGLDRTPGAYDDPERRPLGERCLIGFGSTSGPPALPDYFYNNLHQIVQTPDSVVILTEMVHDVRIVRMNAQHLPQNIRLWLGDSVGHWDGDTLVVDTTNFTNKTRFRGSTENLHVIERFTRVDDKTLLYRFTIDDPATWTKPWTGEMSWPATNEKIYEYACHEGNYALPDILKGARVREKEAAEGKATKN
jgi:hypothetical protein